MRLVGRLVRLALVLLVVVPVLLVAAYRFLPVPITPLMAIRGIDGAGLARQWTALGDIPAAVPQAVIASEDNLFCRHDGFDWRAVEESIDDYASGRRTRGASTLSMQTAKNLFLWPGRDFVRKGLEAYLTVVVEAILPKRRILEIYLNVAEWGDGVYGVAAAARAHFRKPVGALTGREAALLAAVLPNPRAWSPARPTRYIDERARIIDRRVDQLGPLLSCAAPRA